RLRRRSRPSQTAPSWARWCCACSFFRYSAGLFAAARVLLRCGQNHALPLRSREETMRSFDVCECGAPLRMMERPTPKPQGEEVLRRVLAAGVCHSDLHIWDGYYELGGGRRLQLLERGIKLPLTMGHENVGEVVAVGPDAKGVKVGDRRLAHPWMGCGECK